MAIGGNIEQKDIGLSINTDGTFNNTELGEDGKVRLKIVGKTDKGEDVYAKEGEWTSKVINIGDNFREFGKLFTNHTPKGTSSAESFSRTSDNGTVFDDWVKVSEDGTINSKKRVYIQVKVVFKAGKVADIKTPGDIKVPAGTSLFAENEYIETNGSLKLKRKYQQDMAIDESWTEEGSLHRIKVSRDEWIRIDSLNIISKDA